MARQVIDQRKREEGKILLVSDPHDFSNEERWFVECQLQLRFTDEESARAFFERLRTLTTEPATDV